MLDKICLVLTMYWEAVAVFWRNGCAVPSTRFVFCACVYVSFLFPDSVLSLLQYNLSCCFSSVASVLWSTWRFKLKWCEKCEVVFHKIAPGALRSDHMSGKKSYLAFPTQSSYQLSTETVFAQKGDSQAPGIDTTAKCSSNTTCFLPSSPTISVLLLYFPICIERKKHMFLSKGRHIKHKLFLVKGWVLFQGQTEILSERQRAIRALAAAQVCTEYIWSVNIYICHINGLDRPLITD